jgi:hypothetical protein
MKPPTRSPIHKKIEAYVCGQETGAARNIPFQAGALHAMVSLSLAYAPAFETEETRQPVSGKRDSRLTQKAGRSGEEGGLSQVPNTRRELLEPLFATAQLCLNLGLESRRETSRA